MASIPSVPAGWSIGPNGEPISPDGQVFPPGTTFDQGGNPITAHAGSLPVLSIAAGAVAGHYFGHETKWTVVGALAGWYFHPLEGG